MLHCQPPSAPSPRAALGHTSFRPTAALPHPSLLVPSSLVHPPLLLLFYADPTLGLLLTVASPPCWLLPVAVPCSVPPLSLVSRSPTCCLLSLPWPCFAPPSPRDLQLTSPPLASPSRGLLLLQARLASSVPHARPHCALASSLLLPSPRHALPSVLHGLAHLTSPASVRQLAHLALLSPSPPRSRPPFSLPPTHSPLSLSLSASLSLRLALSLSPCSPPSPAPLSLSTSLAALALLHPPSLSCPSSSRSPIFFLFLPLCFSPAPSFLFSFCQPPRSLTLLHLPSTRHPQND